MVNAIKHFGKQPLEHFLPPPRKILRRGTTELTTALQRGEVELSLPRHELAAWMGWGDSVSPCEDKGDASKGHSTKCISDVQRHSEQVEENVKDECCASKGFPNPKKRKRNEKYQKFSDIIGHHHVKLRLKEALLPIALPSHIADSVLKGGFFPTVPHSSFQKSL